MKTPCVAEQSYSARHDTIRRMKQRLWLLPAVLIASAAVAADPRVIKLSSSTVAGLSRTSVRVHVHGSSEEASYEGVALGDVVRKFGAPAGEAIRGKDVSLVAIVKAGDGYQAVFALPELDPAFARRVVLLADRRNGKPLSEKEGPYRLVVPDETRQARWVRQVVSIELRHLE